MVWKVLIRGSRAGSSCASEHCHSDRLCPTWLSFILDRLPEEFWSLWTWASMWSGDVWQIEDGVKIVSSNHCSSGLTTRAAAWVAFSIGWHTSWIITDVIFVCYTVTL